MNDVELFIVLLAVFYLWECLFWIRRPGIAFRSWFGQSWRIVFPDGGLSNRVGGFLIGHPVPGVGGMFPVHWPAFLPTGSHLFQHPDPLDVFNEAPTCALGSVAYADIKEIKIKRHQILINGAPFVSLGSPPLAVKFTKLINELSKSTGEKRSDLIHEWIHRSMDAKGIRDTLDDFNRSTRPLTFLCQLLFLHVALVIPWVGLQFTLSSSWHWLLAVLLLLNTTIAIRFCKLHRTFFAGSSDERFQHTFMMALFPLATIRARETLARPLFEDRHPLAVASVLLRPDSFEQLAARHLRRLDVRMAGTSNKGEQAFFEELRTATRRLVESQGVDPRKLTQPPAPGDPACRSYCPRCGSQFTFSEGRCSDCGSIRVEPVAKDDIPSTHATND